MSTVQVYQGQNLTSNEVADVISVLDHEEPSAYRVEWEGANENPDKTYNVIEFRLGNGSKMVLEGNRIIDANPFGKPQVIYQNPTDGYDRSQRLVDLKLLTTKYHWRHQTKFIARDIQNKLGLINIE
jgi:hypothetical protein